MSLEEKLRQGTLTRRELLQLASAGAGYLLFSPFLSSCNGSNSHYGYEQSSPSNNPNINPKATIKNQQMQEGVVLASWWHDDYEKPWIDATLNKLYDLGVESVSILTTWYQDTANSINITASSQKTPSDSGIENIIAKAKALGMRAVLKPHVDLLDNSWRGNI